MDVFELSVHMNLLSKYCTLLCLNKHSCQFEQVHSISKWSNASAMLVVCHRVSTIDKYLHSPIAQRTTVFYFRQDDAFSLSDS